MCERIFSSGLCWLQTWRSRALSKLIQTRNTFHRNVLQIRNLKSSRILNMKHVVWYKRRYISILRSYYALRVKNSWERGHISIHAGSMRRNWRSCAPRSQTFTLIARSEGPSVAGICLSLFYIYLYRITEPFIYFFIYLSNTSSSTVSVFILYLFILITLLF